VATGGAFYKNKQVVPTVGYDEGRWSKALPVNGNQSLGVTNSPPLGSGHHHVGIMASADGTDEAI
jgi:hypothetical protein